MPKLAFSAYEEPNADFFITLNDSRQLAEMFRGLGATRYEKTGYVAYVWGKRLYPEFISGYGVIDNIFNYGPRLRVQRPKVFGLGSYIYVDLRDDGASIVPDPFAMHRLYVSDRVVTNRLHLAAMVTDNFDVNPALSIFFDNSGFSYNYNTFATPVRGMRSLQVGEFVEITTASKNQIVIKNRREPQTEFEQLSVNEYWNLIEDGAREISDAVDAIVGSGFPVFSDITGGKDSRIVLGGIIASGNIDRVIFNTIPTPRNEVLRADLEIGTGLVGLYGGSYEDRPRPIAYSLQDIQPALQRRRSQVFGFNFQIKPSDVMPTYQVSPSPTIRLLGGGGELYRDRWHNLKFSTPDLETPFTRDFAKEKLRIHANRSLGESLFDHYISALLDTLDSLPGITFGDRLDAHYLNFRTTTQFGIRERLPESLSGLALATSESLLKAARGLPAADKASGRVIFDVLKTFDERLPFYRFDNPFSGAIYDSPYHRSSKYDGQVLEVEPRPELASAGFVKTAHLLPQRPTTKPVDFEQTLSEEIRLSSERFKDPAHPFHFLWRHGLEDYISESLVSGTTKTSVCAGKLRYITDLGALMPSI